VAYVGYQQNRGTQYYRSTGINLSDYSTDRNRIPNYRELNKVYKTEIVLSYLSTKPDKYLSATRRICL